MGPPAARRTKRKRVPKVRQSKGTAAKERKKPKKAHTPKEAPESEISSSETSDYSQSSVLTDSTSTSSPKPAPPVPQRTLSDCIAENKYEQMAASNVALAHEKAADEMMVCEMMTQAAKTGQPTMQQARTQATIANAQLIARIKKQQKQPEMEPIPWLQTKASEGESAAGPSQQC